MSLISSAIITHHPCLSSLEWYRHTLAYEDNSSDPFGSLRSLTQLKHLALDYELMTPATGDEAGYGHALHLLKPLDYLPASLQTLHVTNMSKPTIHNLSNDFLTTGSTTTSLNFLSALFTTLSLPRVNLFFAADSWQHSIGYAELPRRVRKFLPCLIAALSNIGVTMAVWRQQGEGRERVERRRKGKGETPV
jgi:hypothetical protein